MKGFEENNCRLCEHTFCCKKCRIKHEINFHEIHPDCDICIYGQFIWENEESEFLQHLKKAHLPVICHYCKIIFNSIEDIREHRKCNSHTSFKSPAPIKFNTTIEDQDSPILSEFEGKEALKYIFSLATSTPMHRPQDSSSNNLLKTKDPVLSVTPVQLKNIDNSSFKKSIIKKTDCLKVKAETSSKRRVTFSETPSSRTFNEDQSHRNQANKQSKEGSSLQNNSPFTPVAVGATAEQFYSAKSETEQFYSAKTNQEHSTANLKSDQEGLTPLCAPKTSSKTYDSSLETMTSLENKTSEGAKEESKSDCQEISMELTMDEYTPAKPKQSISNNSDNISCNKELLVWDDCPDVLVLSDNICTPEEASNDEKPISKTPFKTPLGKCDYAQVNLCKRLELKGAPNKTENSDDNAKKSDEIPKEADGKNEDDSKSIEGCSTEENVSNSDNGKNTEESFELLNNNHQLGTPANPDKTHEYEDQPANMLELIPSNTTTTPGSNTLWLSACNLDEPDENTDPNKPEESPKKSPESPKPTRRRVSIVMPTPILKRTNVKMKFQIPGHFSSTPIMSSGMLKMKQTKIVEELSTRVLQTPYKTPRGECSYPQETEPSRNQLQEASNSVSVSSMTESSLWSSMTRIVKSVLGGFSHSNDSNTSSSSFKRALSDGEEAPDYPEAPRLKRFKYTDIKCRRPIRDLPAIEAAPAFGQMERYGRSNGVATLEIVKSVSTLYGGPRLRVQCDKATQTDDYLMIGWQPRC